MWNPKLSKDCVAAVKSDGEVFYIIKHFNENYYTLENKDGEYVIVFKKEINNLFEEINNLKELMSEKERPVPHGPSK